MTGAEILTYMKRRLAENGLTVDAERDAELLDYATEGRDGVLLALADAAPVAVKQTLTLTVDNTNDRLWSFPGATRDPLRVLRLYDAGNDQELDPSSSLNNDSGHYAWQSLRLVKLANNIGLTGALTADVVLHPGAITAATTEANVGLPTPCHRAAAKLGVVLALTADEESDASAATGLFTRELDLLEKLYGDYDANGGLAFRAAFLAGLGYQYGDSLT